RWSGDDECDDPGARTEGDGAAGRRGAAPRPGADGGPGRRADARPGARGRVADGAGEAQRQELSQAAQAGGRAGAGERVGGPAGDPAAAGGGGRPVRGGEGRPPGPRPGAAAGRAGRGAASRWWVTGGRWRVGYGNDSRQNGPLSSQTLHIIYQECVRLLRRNANSTAHTAASNRLPDLAPEAGFSAFSVASQRRGLTSRKANRRRVCRPHANPTPALSRVGVMVTGSISAVR